MAIKPPSKGEFQKALVQIREATRLASRHDPDLQREIRELTRRVDKIEKRWEKTKAL